MEQWMMGEVQEDRAVLVGLHASVFTPEEDASWETLDELEALLETAGGECVAKMLQTRNAPDAHTFIGEGKTQELVQLARDNDATLIVFDNELSPSQMRVLEEATGRPVLDRSALILDIFAQRARTGEGKLQVELAQYQYILPRLTGMGKSMSRLGGGIGTRGPGETQLETDRRHIRSRIDRLRRDLESVRKVRAVQRRQRKKAELPLVAIVGYTNAGKSTLLNALTDAGVLQEDKLFATLDPTTRVLKLSGKQEILLTDTVGFIRKLPHHLIDAFRSTLEEAKYADYILHVVDASNPQMDIQMHVVYETLRELGIRDKKIVTLFNKQDIRTDDSVLRDFRADRTICLSARTKEGLEETLEELLREEKIYIERVYDYREAGLLSLIRKKGELLEADYEEDGIHVRAYVPPEIYDKV